MKIKTPTTRFPLRILLSCVSLALWIASPVFADSSSGSTEGNIKTCTGLVSAVDSTGHLLEVRYAWLFQKKFHIGSDCAYALLDPVLQDASGLRPGQMVRVVYRDADGVLVASRIIQIPIQVSGWVKSVDRTNFIMVLQPSDFGSDRRYQLTRATRILLLGGQEGALSDLQPGNHVSITCERPPGIPIVQLINQTSATFSGALTAIDLDERSFKARSFFESKSFVLGNHCVIDMDGEGHGRLADLRPDEKLDVTYDAVNGVNVVNRIAPARTPESVSGANQANSGS